MASTLREKLLVQLGLDAREFQRDIKTATKDIGNIKRSVDGLSTGMKTLKRVATVSFAGWGISSIASSFLNASKTAEGFQTRLTVLLGSAREGNRLFDEMARFASKVPFEYEKIMASATALAGVMKGGVNEIKRWMPMITDLAAASGLSIEETTGQVIRMYSAGAGAADLFRERGITAMLGFQAGVSYTAEETKKKLIESFESPMSKFRGASNALADDWTGIMSMFGDLWFQFRKELMDGTGLFDDLKEAASGLLGFLRDNMPAIIGFFKDAFSFARDLFDVLVSPISGAIDQLRAAADESKRFADNIKEAPSNFAQMWAALGTWGKNIVDTFKFIGTAFGEIMALMVTDAYEFVKLVAKQFYNLGNVIWEAIKLPFTRSMEGLKGAFNSIIGDASNFSGQLNANWNGMTGSLSQSWETMIDSMINNQIGFTAEQQQAFERAIKAHKEMSDEMIQKDKEKFELSKKQLAELARLEAKFQKELMEKQFKTADAMEKAYLEMGRDMIKSDMTVTEKKKAELLKQKAEYLEATKDKLFVEEWYASQVLEIDEETLNARLQLYDRLLTDIGRKDEQYFEIKKQLIDAEYKEYKKLYGDIEIIARAFADKYIKLEEEKILATGSFVDGIRVGYQQMERDMTTMAEHGKEVFDSFVRDAKTTFSDTLYYGLKGDMDSIEDAWKNLMDSMLRSFTQKLGDLAINMALNAVMGGGGGQGGGGGLLSGAGSLISSLLGGGTGGGGLLSGLGGLLGSAGSFLGPLGMVAGIGLPLISGLFGGKKTKYGEVGPSTVGYNPESGKVEFPGFDVLSDEGMGSKMQEALDAYVNASVEGVNLTSERIKKAMPEISGLVDTALADFSVELAADYASGFSGYSISEKGDFQAEIQTIISHIDTLLEEEANEFAQMLGYESRDALLEALQKFEEAMAASAMTIGAAFKAGIEAGDWEVFEKSLHKSLYDTVLSGFIDAMMQSTLFQQALQPFFLALDKALTDSMSGGAFDMGVFRSIMDEAFGGIDIDQFRGAFDAANDYFLALAQSLGIVDDAIEGTATTAKSATNTILNNFKSHISSLKSEMDRIASEMEAALAPWVSFRSSVADYRKSNLSTGWGIKDYVDRLNKLLTMDQSSLDVLQEQFDVLKKIEELTSKEVEQNNILISSLGDTILRLTGGDLSPVQSAEFFNLRYANLLTGGMGGDRGLAEQFNQFIPEYSEFMGGFGDNYASVVSGMVRDIGTLQGTFEGQNDLATNEMLLTTSRSTNDLLSAILHKADEQIAAIRGQATAQITAAKSAYESTINSAINSFKSSLIAGGYTTGVAGPETYGPWQQAEGTKYMEKYSDVYNAWLSGEWAPGKGKSIGEAAMQHYQLHGKSEGRTWFDIGIEDFAKQTLGLQGGGLTSGLNIVGEQGPELLVSSPGDRVVSYDESMNAISEAVIRGMAMGGGAQELHIYIDGKEIPYSVIKHGMRNSDFVRGIRDIAGR